MQDMESSRLDSREERIMPFRVVDAETGEIIFENQFVQPLFEYIEGQESWNPKEIYATPLDGEDEK